ncbi:MAG: membrane protein insertion efficiency factor YidD [Oscillospiraceae bacterium]|nr:membrane protein insertion efficiency factor YidD [Oscillospiraceae bacterium]
MAILFALCYEYFSLSATASILLTLLVLFGYCLLRLKRIVIWCVECYQRFAPISVRCMCRFEPSCSEYMILAVTKHGPFKGICKGFHRLWRCSHKGGGFDYP